MKQFFSWRSWTVSSALLLLIPLTGIFYTKYYLPALLAENSGVVSLPENHLLWINDSGNEPILYLTDSAGLLLREIKLPIQNRDWEELSRDECGNIYIGDFGNNNNQRKDLRIYKLDKNFEITDSILFTFPALLPFSSDNNKMSFDVEAMFWNKGKLHLFTKNKMHGNGLTTHYSLDDSSGNQEALFIENLFLDDYLITGACIKNNSSDVYLITYYYHFWLGFIPESDSRIFHYRLVNDKMIATPRNHMTVPSWIAAAQYEAITCIDYHTAIISAEGRKFRRPFFRKIKLK